MSTSAIVSNAFAEHNRECDSILLESAMGQFSKQETAALIIDGPNFQGMLAQLGISPDFGTLFDTFRRFVSLRAIYYFTAVSDDAHHNTTRDQIRWLARNGVRVVTKPSVKMPDESGVVRWKGNMDVDIAVTALTECQVFDTVILSSGDGDFSRLMRAIRARGQRAVLLASEKTRTRHLSEELRTSVDGFIDMAWFSGTMTMRAVTTGEAA